MSGRVQTEKERLARVDKACARLLVPNPMPTELVEQIKKEADEARQLQEHPPRSARHL